MGQFAPKTKKKKKKTSSLPSMWFTQSCVSHRKHHQQLVRFFADSWEARARADEQMVCCTCGSAALIACGAQQLSSSALTEGCEAAHSAASSNGSPLLSLACLESSNVNATQIGKPASQSHCGASTGAVGMGNELMGARVCSYASWHALRLQTQMLCTWVFLQAAIYHVCRLSVSDGGLCYSTVMVKCPCACTIAQLMMIKMMQNGGACATL
jgi:hypothetical protein